MSPPCTLSIPIDLQALIVSYADLNVSQDHAKFATLAYRFDQLASGDGNAALDPVFSIDSLPPALQNLPQSSTDGSNLAAGVHLHWALPDALIRGVTEGSEKVRFPHVPNRWLVIRTVTRANGQPMSRQGWVVESDYVWSENHTAPDAQARRNTISPCMIDRTAFEQGGGVPYAFRQGRVYDLDGWAETLSSPRSPTLSATGFGLPEFSAVYAHSRNVFGFWDDSEELANVINDPAMGLSYTVSGWFSDPAHDPLNTITTSDVKRFVTALQSTLGWTVSVNTPDELPTRSVCQGFLAQVKWAPQLGPMVPERQATQPLVAVGNTTAQAMAAFVVHQMNPPPANPAALESLLDALQIGLTGNATDLSSCSQWDERRHHAQFQPHQGGTVWQMVPRSAAGPSLGSVGSETLTQAAKTPLSALPETVSETLNLLNEAQDQADRLTRDVESLRAQQFSDWHKVMQSVYHDAFSWSWTTCTPPASMDYFAWVKTQILDGMVQALDLALERCARQKDALIAMAPTYDLKAVGADAFWEAHDPVIVLNPGMVPSLRHGGDGRFRDDGYLLCRLDHQTISSMTAIGSTVPLSVSALPLPLPAALAFLKPWVDESLWFDLHMAPWYAQGLKDVAPAGNTLPNMATLTAQIRAAQTTFYKPNPSSAPVETGVPTVQWNGVLPSPVGQEQWSQPFLPTGMQWEIKYWPDGWISNPLNAPSKLASDPYPSTRSAYGNDFIEQHFEVDPGDTELTFTGHDGFTPTDDNALVFRGSTTLGTRPDVQLKARLKAYLDRYKDPTPDGALTRALTTAFPVVSQTARGFNQWLLARQQELQVDIGNPLTLPDGEGVDTTTMNAFLAMARDAVGDQRSLAPLPQLTVFNGVRSGYFQVTQARVVDAFGQTMTYSADASLLKPVYSQSLAAGGPGARNVPCVHLPPRVTQPSRLNLHWLSARNNLVQSNNLPLESPLFGWVLYNKIDDALAVYTAEGLAYGTLRNCSSFWGSSADSIWTPAPMLHEVQVSPDLVAFCAGVAQAPVASPTRAPSQYLAALLDCVENAGAAFVSPRLHQDTSRAVLMSRPLALVKVSVGLALKGLPAMDQGMADFVGQLNLPHPKLPRLDAALQPQLNRFTGGFEAVRFPLEIGDASDPDDSVVGFFAHKDASSTPNVQDYQTFYSAFGTSGAVGVQAKTTVSATFTQAPQTLTVLMDPRGSLSVTPFVLPTQTLTIPTSQYVDALARIRVSLNAFPLLTSMIKPSAPVPQVAGENWTLVKAGSPWTNTPIKPSPNTAGDYLLALVEGWVQTNASAPSTADQPDQKPTQVKP